jgi:hypothetical protein
MQAQWSSTRENGTLIVRSCTESCPFRAGETIQFFKIFGDVTRAGPYATLPGETATAGYWSSIDNFRLFTHGGLSRELL